MHENTRKSFYIFLTMVLGVLLFLMLQRAAFLIAFLAGADVGSLPAQALSIVTSAIAVAFGSWYGIWLGIVWYAAVYEERTVRSMFGWLRQGSGKTVDGSWQIDDLVAMETVGTGRDSEKLEFFEANTVKFGGNPVSGRTTHVPVAAKAKVAARRPRSPRKTTVKKTVS